MKLSDQEVKSLKESYNVLLNSLQSKIGEAREETKKRFVERLDEMSKLGDKLWLYEYILFISTVRREPFIQDILLMASKEGYRPMDGWEYDQDKSPHTIAYTNTLRVAKGTTGPPKNRDHIKLIKDGAIARLPLLRIKWQDHFFSAELVDWKEIEKALKEL